MFHSEIINGLLNFFEGHTEYPFKLLDLGCGDSTTAYRSLKNTKVISYTGVDLSGTALDFARRNMENFNIKKEFILGDLLGVLDILKEN